MLEQLQQDLRDKIKPDKANTLARFFKTGKGEYAEDDVFLGIVVPDIRAIAKKYQSLSIDDTLILLHSIYHEERLCALYILIQYYKKDITKQETIYNLYLANIKYINNWDLIDTSAEHIIGAYLYDKPRDILYSLAQSKNLWEKRLSILATFYFIKHNQANTTLDIAIILLNDKHDLIHKAVGWMLREVGKRCSEDIVLLFLDKYYKSMPRTMLRYAIERLDIQTKAKYMKK